MNKNRILILEANARAAVGIARSFIERGLYVIAGSEHRFCAAFSVRGLNEKVIYPSLHSGAEEFIHWLMNYLEKKNIDLIVPLGEVGVELICRHQKKICEHTNLLMPPHESFVKAYDKILTNKAAQKAEVAIPKTWYPDEQGLDSVFKEADFPVLIKPSLGVGARGIIHIDSKAALERNWQKTQKSDIRYFVQEAVPFTGTQFVVDLLTDKNSKKITAVVSEKIRFFPVNGGASTLSKSIKSSYLCEQSEKLIKAIGYYGVSNVDWIEDKRDGTIKLLEINPRFGEMHAICSACGIDLPWLYYNVATGNPIEPILDYPEQKYLRFLPTDLMWFLASKNRFKSQPGFFKAFKSNVKSTLIEKNDYMPLFGYLMENIALLAKPGKFIYRFFR